MGKADDDEEENPSGWMVLSEGRRHMRCASSGTVRVGGGASEQSARTPPSPPENKQLTNAALRTLRLRRRSRARRRAGRKSMVLRSMYVVCVLFLQRPPRPDALSPSILATRLLWELRQRQE
ncbi:unnamed protein product [Ectocarpus sp. 4 AP-2014]